MKKKSTFNKKNLYKKIGVIVLLSLSIVFLFYKIYHNDDNKSNLIIDDSTEIKDIDNSSLQINSRYCILLLSTEYKSYYEIRTSDKLGYKIEFYGCIDEKEEVHLFDICFNSDDGDLLGYFDGIENEVVNVSVEMFELEFDSSWTEDEKNIIYSMQEESNFVIDSLSENDNYVMPN